MAVCQNCGTELQDGAKFCENCGARVEVAAPVAAQPVYTEPVKVGNTPEQESLCKSALVLSIVGAALSELGLPGIIVSAIAKGKVKKATQAGAVGGKLKAARIISNIGLALSIVMTIFWAIYIFLIGGLIVYGISQGGFDELEYSLNSIEPLM